MTWLLATFIVLTFLGTPALLQLDLIQHPLRELSLVVTKTLQPLQARVAWQLIFEPIEATPNIASRLDLSCCKAVTILRCRSLRLNEPRLSHCQQTLAYRING
jgi:hypothetical protein